MRVTLNFIAACLLLVAGVLTGTTLSATQASAVASCSATTGSVSTSMVICTENGTVISRAPIASTGTYSQEIITTIDPATTTISSTNQISAPAGWTLSYFDGTSWSSTTPANSNAWAAVTKIKASGPLISQGSENGNQIASRSQTVALAQSGSFTAAGGGDGWSVIFDNTDHIYNIWHHDGSSNNPSVDCHTRSGSTCGPGWPFALSPYHTNTQSEGWVDNTNKHLWFATNSSSATGFACVDISNLITGPVWCGGSSSSAFIAAGAAGGNGFNLTGGLANIGTRLFTWENTTGKLLCVDTALNNGNGGLCASQPATFSGVTSAPWGGNAGGGSTLLASGGKLYGSAGTTAVCIDPVTFALCSGWPLTLTKPGYAVFQLPNASGQIIGLCFIDKQDTGPSTGANAAQAADPANNPCYSLSGVQLTRPASLLLYTSSAFGGYGKNPEVSGSRVYWAASWVSDANYYCWDASLNSGAGAYCPNWPISNWPTYTIQLDPLNNNCLWSNNDYGQIKPWDAVRGVVGCTTPPSTVEFDPNLVIPRLGCSTGAANQSWKNFALTAPAATTYNSATLTVMTADGTPIPGYISIPISGSRIVDLSGLAISTSGTNPKFAVSFTWSGVGTPAAPTGSVTAVGGQAELCMTPVTLTVPCPTTLGPLPTAPTQTSVVLADGSAVLSGNTQVLTQATTSLSMTSPALASCASTLSGTALSAATSTPISGVTVSLLDSNNNPILSGGQPVTATTNLNGTYSFGTLVFGSYKVRFPDLNNYSTVATSSVALGGNGTTNASAGTVISAASTLAQNQNGVINATYVVTAAPAGSLASTGNQSLQMWSITAALSVIGGAFLAFLVRRRH
ncbi:SdrD B-like domain-containing protein [Aurantimicrobium minutum]|uniref:SdrD B-like domain-containing protein n=1 Tax=Aurantimicrobium minutum TaxID=708131 RepID=UPI00247344C8|nr:SdrD B-like domain-containing protein [Aurantimicrobium minutum]MDH6240046.1 hypothetical protein [Aurantimicrobium minutum]